MFGSLRFSLASGRSRPASVFLFAMMSSLVSAAPPSLSVPRASREESAVEWTPPPEILGGLRATASPTRLRVPISRTQALDLELTRFDVVTAATQFLIALPWGEEVTPNPDVVTYRGQVAGESGSHVFLAVSGSGVVFGRIEMPEGEPFVITPGVSSVGGAAAGPALVHRAASSGAIPDLVPPCGVTDAHRRTVALGPVTAGITVAHGPQVAFLAIEGDQSFTGLFPDLPAAQAYVVALVGAVSDIYLRDLDVRLVLSRVRLWPLGGEPFGAEDLGGFADYWLSNEDTSGLNLVHLLSGRRDLGYGGIAYVGGFCGGPTFGISGFLLGSFPIPVDDPELGNWDVIVSAHEMGHNLGTFHTHDGYNPPIDQCGSANVWARGEIMSYCHILQGGTLNIEMRFSTRIQDVIADEVAFEGCLWFDCNQNDRNDATDILLGSSDADSDGVPDECEDCNHNGVHDALDILGGAADADGNGVPDACESNCNGNGLPDEFETAFGFAPDANANRVPDVCEADCDGDSVADFVEIAATGTLADIDRDGVPDVCIDCNGNGLRDWADAGRTGFIYITDAGSDVVRVYHSRSGVLEATLGGGMLADPYDLTFGPDGALYVSSFADDRVVRIDPDAGAAADFVTAGSGGLDGPTGLAFAYEALYVGSSLTNEILRYDAADGAFLGVLPNSTSPDLIGPRDLLVDGAGDLWVGTSNHSVLLYIGLPQTPFVTFVSPGSGGLNGPRQMVFDANFHLLVVSELSNNVLEYDSNGAFLAPFNDEYPLPGPTGIARGPGGNVFVARPSQPVRIVEYGELSGRYLRSFIRGDFAMTAPTSLVFRPAAPQLDCNENAHPDDCDITEGASADVNQNGTPDECEAVTVPIINWDPYTRSTRSLTMSLLGPPPPPASAGVGTAAIQIKMVDLQHPAPHNRPQYPPPNFTAWDTRSNGMCSGATTSPNYNGHHCDSATGASECLGPNNAISTDDGGCASLLACTAAGETGGCNRWVGPVGYFREKQDVLTLGVYKAARLQCTPYYRDWTTEGVFTVFGGELLPSSTYEGRTFGSDCKGVESTCTNVSPVVTMLTRRSGDVAAAWNPPDVTDQPDGGDVVTVLNKFKGLVGSPSNATVLLQPNAIDPNVDVSGSDVVATVDAFKGLSYPFSGPCPCPSTVTCGALVCPPGNCGAGVCVKTCQGGTNDGLPCGDNTHDHCPGGGTCPATGFCRDRCGRCTP